MRMVLLLMLCWLSALAADTAPRVRPATWAQQVLSAELENWYKVDDHVYRCRQPDRVGMRQLQAWGVRTVLNLRNHHSDDDEAQGTALTLVRVPCDAGELKYAHLVSALSIITTATAPIAVHCWHGSDRTGAVIAGYRIAVHGWTPEQAVDEMVHGGYGHHEYYANLRRLIVGIDPQRLRSDLGLSATAARVP